MRAGGSLTAAGKLLPFRILRHCQGDFNSETTSSGAPLPLYGTAACAALLAANQNCMPVDPTTGAAFPNNQIPSTEITNRLALVALKYNYWPTPTLANQGEGVNELHPNYGTPLTTNQQTYRIDQNLGKLGINLRTWHLLDVPERFALQRQQSGLRHRDAVRNPEELGNLPHHQLRCVQRE